jgi:glycerate-2-kinase
MPSSQLPAPFTPESASPSIRATPHNQAGELALRIYSSALVAVRAERLIPKALRLHDSVLAIQEHTLDLADFERVLVIGAGKAAAAMAASLEEILGDRITAGVVATKHDHAVPTRRVQVLEASHPIPGEDSVEAGRQIHALTQSAGERDLVICLLSGGASALMELPVKGITLQDLQTTTNLLLRAGANIAEINAVRSRLSQIKNGGIADAAYPAALVCLALSDVIGNCLEVIGSGPCIPAGSAGREPMEVIESLGLGRALPARVKRVLGRPSSGVRRPNPRVIPHYLIGDIWTAIEAAREAAESIGLRTLVLTGSLTGEARTAGAFFGAISHDWQQGLPEFDCIIAGGETVVKVSGSGLGGRAQELAASAGFWLPAGAALLCAGTDGTDGPTDAAGALVDAQTWARVRDRGFQPHDVFAANDTYPALHAAESLVFTGPTHTNVSDLVILVRGTDN